MLETDPFTLVHNALWALADASQPLTQLVKPKNKIKFNSETDRDPMKQEVMASDLPELVLAIEGTNEVNLHASSCTSMITRQYAWMISSGDIRANEILHPVEWAVCCAMVNWRETLSALTWREQLFVKRVNNTTLTTGMSDPERNRGIKGWSSIWRCEIEMHFESAAMRSFHLGVE